MKLRNTAIAAALSLVPIGQPLVFGTTAVVMLSATKAYAETVEFFYNRSLDKYDKKNYQGALEDLNKAIKINGNYSQLYYNRGVIKEQNFKNYSEAINDYKRAIELNPNYVDAYINLGISTRKIGDEKGSCIAYKKAISLGDKKTLQWFNDSRGSWCRDMAKNYMKESIKKAKTKDFKNAILDLNSAIEVEPRNSLALTLRAIAKRELVDYKGAIEDYDIVLEINPNDVEALNNRGLVKRFSRDDAGAIKDFKKALELNPSSASDYYFNIALAKEGLQDYQGANNFYTKLLEINPKDATAYANRGWNKTQLKDYQGAINDFNQSIEINPNNQFTYRWRGDAKKALGDSKGSCIDWGKASELKDSTATRMLKAHCE